MYGADPPLWTVLARHLVPTNDERPPQVAFHRFPLRRGDVVKGEVVFLRLGRALDARVTHLSYLCGAVLREAELAQTGRDQLLHQRLG